ncbi:hypothetical protein PGTUg99_017448 [Puccinia graminis f. sp. tritici]|uniref:Uncharacterized protein n=1 Tax=Puccinia graminis f. sp. tritici TaxID=56615 RepID=A0A5B0LTB6_PUCGR|nr:hypothetical protein PGTUg99_017448 [Puccinia graminis f. sp. tritici]
MSKALNWVLDPDFNVIPIPIQYNFDPIPRDWIARDLQASDPPRTNSDQKTSIPQLGFTAVSSPCYRLESFTLWNLPTLSVRITK